MAVSYVTGGAIASTEDDSPRVLTIDTTAGTVTNRLLLIAVTSGDAAEVISSVSYASQGAMTLVSNTNAPLYVFAMKAPTAGSNNLSVSLQDTYGRCNVLWAVFDGVDQTTSYGTIAHPTSTSTSTPTTGSQTCPADGMLWAAIRHGYCTANGSVTTGTQTGTYRDPSAETGHVAGYRSTTGEIIYSFNQTNNGLMVVVPINAVASGGGATLSGSASTPGIGTQTPGTSVPL